MEKATPEGGWRAILPAVLLVGCIALSVLLSGERVSAIFGPSDTELGRRKQEFRASRTKLTLQLSKCQRDAAMAGDAYICGGSSVIYKNLAASTDCRLAREVADELGLSPHKFSLPLAPKSKSFGS